MKILRYYLTGAFFLFNLMTCWAQYQEPIQARAFPEKNTPEHTFKFRPDKLKDTIISLFTIENQLKDSILSEIFIDALLKDRNFLCVFKAETSKDILFSKEYFSMPNTKNDIFLGTLGQLWFSMYYFSKDHPLEFISNYIVKLDKANDSMTKVIVEAYHPQVVNGMDCCGPHGPYSRYTPVAPTSIEEYTLLEFIARKLGDTTLAPIKLPKD